MAVRSSRRENKRDRTEKSDRMIIKYVNGENRCGGLGEDFESYSYIEDCADVTTEKITLEDLMIEFKEIYKKDDKDWLDYIRSTVLEITCGEGPFLVSRYDTVSGEYIEPFDRIGLLDRKIRVVNENINGSNGWFEIILEAYKAIYGYEFQGDNLFLARKNLLLTFIDNYQNRVGKYADKEKLLQVAEIISWNLWQMDGLKYVVPNSCKTTNQVQISLFNGVAEKECPGCKKNNIYEHAGIYCKIKDWRTNSVGNFVNIINK